MASDTISGLKYVLCLIIGTWLVGNIIDGSFGHISEAKAVYGTVVYLWGFLFSLLLVIIHFITHHPLDTKKEPEKERGKEGTRYRFLRDDEGGVYRLDLPNADGEGDLAAWKRSPTGTWDRLDDRAVIGLLAPGEFERILETDELPVRFTEEDRNDR